MVHTERSQAGVEQTNSCIQQPAVLAELMKDLYSKILDFSH